jgi:hypothetical protein
MAQKAGRRASPAPLGVGALLFLLQFGAKSVPHEPPSAVVQCLFPHAGVLILRGAAARQISAAFSFLPGCDEGPRGSGMVRQATQEAAVFLIRMRGGEGEDEDEGEAMQPEEMEDGAHAEDLGRDHDHEGREAAAAEEEMDTHADDIGDMRENDSERDCQDAITASGRGSAGKTASKRQPFAKKQALKSAYMSRPDSSASVSSAPAPAMMSSGGGEGAAPSVDRRRLGLRGWGAGQQWLSADDAPRLRDKDEELRVPDHVESIKEALSLALDGQTVYVRAGEHRWRGEIQAARNKTLFLRGELGSRLWGQWARRHLQPRAGVDNYCVSLPLGSQGSFGSVVLAHETLGSFDACIQISGGPWILGHCKVLSSHATALHCSAQADILVRRCCLGGLEPAELVEDQVFGNNLARYGVYAKGNASATLQACAIENTGRAGGIGARFAGCSRASLQGCMLRCNDIALSLDDKANIEVKGSTVQRNAWSAWHVGYKCSTAGLQLADNTVIGREWFNNRRPGEKIPQYFICCNGRGCTKCYFSLDSMIPNRVIIERSQLMNGRTTEREEDDMRYAEDEDGNHTRMIIHYNQDNDEVAIEHETFADPDKEKAMEIPDNITGPAYLWRMNKPGPLNETRLGIHGLPAVAKWWDRMNSAYI